MGDIFVGQTALTLRLTTGENIAGATCKIKYKKPDDTEGEWDADINDAATGVIDYEVDDADDIDDAHTYVYNGVSDTAPSASGELSYPTIAFTDGADMDSWAEGELAIVRIYRDHDHGDDGMTGDAELWALFGLET